MQTIKHPLWLEFLLLFLIPIVGIALGVGATFLFGVNQVDFGNLVINLFFLAACLFLLRLFKFTRRDLGLELIKEQIKNHVFLALAVFSFYILFYIFIIRISALKPFSSSTAWGLLTYLIVVIAEELYFRGTLYGYFEKRFSAKTALIVSSLIFGLFHANQGIREIVSKAFTGWLWGSIRYSTGMIFLLIFPIHFVYNSIWLLFAGNWDNPPVWAIYALPAIEFLLGLIIVFVRSNQSIKQ